MMYYDLMYLNLGFSDYVNLLIYCESSEALSNVQVTLLILFDNRWNSIDRWRLIGKLESIQKVFSDVIILRLDRILAIAAEFPSDLLSRLDYSLLLTIMQ